MGKNIAILICLFLVGCATEKQNIVITNESIEAPSGFIEYCKREPNSSACSNNK